MATVNNKKTKESERKKVLFVYRTRVLWVDVTTLGMLLSYHWDFWSLGKNPVPDQIAYVYWAVLAAYWIIKEQVRNTYKDIRSRAGGWYVVLWGLVLAEFSFMMQLRPGTYHLPAYLTQTCIVVLLGYVGVLSARRFFKTLFPPLAPGIDDEEEK